MKTATTLEESYRACRRLNAAHGSTYYWSTYLLPRPKRPHVHALYAFCRRADDIVDAAATPDEGDEQIARRAEALAAFGRRFFDDLDRGGSDDPILAAVVDTVLRYGIGADCFRRFLHSMRMDLQIPTYETFDDLLVYMDGSAAVIGEMMLPILAPSELARAEPHARDLGIAFQLTNFLRDVGEDLDRGRVYVPQEDVRRFGAGAALAERRVTDEWIALMRFEISRTRAYYDSADVGLSMLPPASRRCIRSARVLYGRILDRIEANGYDSFSMRARVPTWQKVAAAAGVLRA